MSDYDSNYSFVNCPHCKKNLSKNKIEGSWIDDLDEDKFDFFQCQECKKFFKARLDIYKTYEYTITKPSKEEVKEYNLVVDKDAIVEDCPGQSFMWENLFSKNSI